MRAPAAIAWSARRSVPERPSAGAGSSSSNRRSAGARNGSCLALARRPFGQCRRLRGLHGGPGARGYVEHRRCRPAAGGPERLELARGQLAQTGERRLAGEGADDDQLGRGLLGVGEREHVEELELVVEVVLEPEHDLEVVAERLEQLAVTPLER